MFVHRAGSLPDACQNVLECSARSPVPDMGDDNCSPQNRKWFLYVFSFFLILDLSSYNQV